LKHTLALLTALALGLAGTAAMATEEPKFERIAQHDRIELRRYPALIVAETFVSGDLDQASGKGFRILAGYIFGDNVTASPALLERPQPSEKIAMTAPVTMEPVGEPSRKIAMTAPVTMEPLTEERQSGDAPIDLPGSQRWRMHFVMPSHYTLSTLPKPNNPAVQLREVPARTWAVLRYSGFNTQASIQKRTDELLAWLAARNIRTVGSPQLARYNPPWTLPMFRRNEILQEIEYPSN
jgi:hypothetical protein